MGRSDFEKCTECGYQIPRSEQAYVFNGRILCEECDSTLRSGPRIKAEGTQNMPHDALSSSALQSSQVAEEVSRMMQAEGDCEFDTIPESGSPIAARTTTEAEASTDKIPVNKKKRRSPIPLEREDLSDGKLNSARNNASAQLVIRLPSFLHSCCVGRDISSAHSRAARSFNGKHGLVMLLCLATITAIAAVLLKRFIF